MVISKFKRGQTTLLGFVLGIFLLYQFLPPENHKVRFEELALGQENTAILGEVEGIKVHCYDLNDLESCLTNYLQKKDGQPVFLWLGNSQVHAINQYHPGEETAAPELHRRLQKQGVYFLTFSQPNASLQEHYLFFAYLLNRLPVKTLLLPVVFDDMREDGIRSSLVDALKDPDVARVLQRTTIGRSLIANHGDQDAAGNDMAALKDTTQERSEIFLNEKLKGVWSLWAARPDLRGKLFESLYLLRNWVLGIDPTSTRRKIPGRYAKNRDAFMAVLELASNNKVKVLVYVVPLRNDVKVPYSPDEYAEFKSEITSIARKYNARFANLENIVPSEFWGTKDTTSLGGGQELDFMHFRAEGHELLADALYKELIEMRDTP